jgi:sulfatase modifying factor 1
MKKIILIVFILSCNQKIDIKRQLISIGEVEMTMVWIPNGSFNMGSDDSMALDNEKPVHKITLDGFWMSETPVTNVQFAVFINESGHITTAEIAPTLEEIMSQVPPGTTPPPKEMLVPGSLTFINRPTPANPNSDIRWWKWSNNSDWLHPYGKGSSIEEMDNHPVVQISWFDALAFSKWAMMSLPTEAQWEYAAKKGEVTNRREMNIWQGTFPVNNSRIDGYEKTNPVYAYKPNKIGLYDMAGNVWEWVADWYRPDTYSMKGRQKNPTGPLSSYDPVEPTVPKRVTRGGSFLCNDQYCAGYRTTARMRTSPDTSLEHTGFRVVMTKAQMEKYIN